MKEDVIFEFNAQAVEIIASAIIVHRFYLVNHYPILHFSSNNIMHQNMQNTTRNASEKRAFIYYQNECSF